MSRRSDDKSPPSAVQDDRLGDCPPDSGASEGACDVVAIDSAAVQSAKRGLLDSQELRLSADIFAALGDPTRLSILTALATQELCVCDISAVIDVSQSAVSHQLRVLRQLNLVTFRRDGKRAVYRLADDHVRVLLQVGSEHAGERTR